METLKTAHPLLATLPEEEQQFIAQLVADYHLTFQTTRNLIIAACDLMLWQEAPLSSRMSGFEPKGQGKQLAKHVSDFLLKPVDDLRKAPTNYSYSTPPDFLPIKEHVIFSPGKENIFGSCPCPPDGEQVRCCNLKTLDVIKQCGFACSYCSIQSFYHKNSITIPQNLKERLETLDIGNTWHIGTGQSSDSLLYGNDYGTLDALIAFAHQHPDVIIELKTKSARIDWLKNCSLPHTIVCTWSLNAPTIITHEEHLTATLEQRINAARAVADAGIPIGFHLHPLVYFSGWEEEYRHVVQMITEHFSAKEVLMISLGTLTFTRSVIKTIRSGGRPGKILQMEMNEAAGKFSYPFHIKETIFSTVYQAFPDSWKTSGPFFYLCMEDPALWKKVFGYEYASNAEFEQAMKNAYRSHLRV